MFPSRALSRLPLYVLLALIPFAGTMFPSPVLAAPVSSASGSTSPQSLVLHARDLPASFGGGFRDSVGGPISNAQVAAVEHVSTHTIDQHGRLGGYSTTFSKRLSKGGISIVDSVGAYRSVADAHWQYDKFLSITPVPPHSTLIAMSGIGNEARAYVQKIVYGGATVTTAGVYFRRGAYDARIDIIEAGGSVHASDVQTLTRVLDGRLRAAH